MCILLLMHNTLRALRLERGLTLREAAERMGTIHSQIQKLESGERRLTAEWIDKIARAYGVSLECVIGHDGPSTAVPISGTITPSGVIKMHDTTDTISLPQLVAETPGLRVYRVRESIGLLNAGMAVCFRPMALGEPMHNQAMLVEMESGQLIYCRLQQGSKPGLWNLVEIPQPHKDVRIVAAYAVVYIAA